MQKEQKTEYKFVGKDGSMGFRNNKTYSLEVREANIMERIAGYKIIVDEPMYCPYDSYLTFYENWKLKR